MGQRNRETVGFFRGRGNVLLICHFSLGKYPFQTLAKTDSPRPELWKKYFEEGIIIAGNISESTQFFKDYNWKAWGVKKKTEMISG